MRIDNCLKVTVSELDIREILAKYFSKELGIEIRADEVEFIVNNPVRLHPDQPPMLKAEINCSITDTRNLIQKEREKQLI